MPRYSVLLIPDDVEGGYTVTVPVLPGVTTQGETVEEAIAMAREAIELHLEGFAADQERIPAECQSPMLVSIGVEPKLPPDSVFSTVHEHFSDLLQAREPVARR